MPKRIKTSYPGVYYREANRVGGKGTEKVYYVVFKQKGKVFEEKVGRQYADDMTPARASGIRADLIEGKKKLKSQRKKEEQKNKKWTIQEIWEEYKSKRTENKGLAIDEGRYNKYIKPLFGKKEPKDIEPIQIDRFQKKYKKKLSDQTRKHVLNLLTWIINYGVSRKLCTGLSFKMEKPSVNNEKIEDLSPGQLQDLLKAIQDDPNIHAKNMMLLALYSGMRRGEMFKLKWENVDFNRGIITIIDPKGGKDQRIPLNDAAAEILKKHPKEKNSPYVFPGKDGKQRVTIAKPVNRIKANANLPKDFRPLHGLRHVYASMLASSGKVDMYTLQKLLTHKDPRMTQRYAHLRDEALKAASNLAGEIINGNVGVK